MGPLNRAFAETWITGDRLLPPCLRLHAVRQPIRFVLIGQSAYVSTESVRPVCISQERAQHRPAKELVAGADLRRDRELAQPAVVLTGAMCVVESALERKRDVFREKDF